MSKENITKPTEAQIAEWKKKYSRVHKLTVEDKTCYLRAPDRRTMSLAMSQMARNQLLEATESILANCWLGGDMEIQKEDEYFFGAMGSVSDIINFKNATLEKL